MKKRIIALSLSFISSFAFANVSMNITTLRHEIVKYHQSGQYTRDVAYKIDQAERYLRHRVRQHARHPNSDPLAMVLNIDDTALSNYAYLRRLNFGGTERQMKNAFNRQNNEALKPTLHLFNYAKQHGVTIFFISSRREALRKITRRNLHQAGFNGWKKIDLLPNDYARRSIVPFASRARKHIVDEGFDVVLNIGDQSSFLKQGFTDRAIKLPNSFYYIA